MAPLTVAGWIPYALSDWRFDAPFFGTPASRVIGAVVVAVAATALAECFIRFAIVGLGTPAPIAPTRHLVVSGLYRHTRNPMYVSVVGAILGQALLFGSVVLLGYAAIVWVAFHVFVVGYEEPTLRRQFVDYDAYRAGVPRWWPRWRPRAPSA